MILYNDTPTSPADPLIGWWDYGAPITLNTAGDFIAEVEIGTGAGPFTSPNLGYISIAIVEDLG